MKHRKTSIDLNELVKERNILNLQIKLAEYIATESIEYINF